MVDGLGNLSQCISLILALPTVVNGEEVMLVYMVSRTSVFEGPLVVGDLSLVAPYFPLEGISLNVHYIGVAFEGLKLLFKFDQGVSATEEV